MQPTHIFIGGFKLRWYWKILLCVLCVWLFILGIYEIFFWYEDKKIQENWPKYRNQKLYNQAEYIQKEFSVMERTSFSILDQFVHQSSLIVDIARWNEHSRTKIFEQLLQFSEAKELDGRGIAIYNYKRECIAWHNCAPDISPALLDECLIGKRFSTISKSSRNVFVMLCTFVPIPHHILQQYVGVVVCFLPLDKNYPLSTRYIQSQSFANYILQQYDIQDIQIQYEQNSIIPKSAENSLISSLLNLNGQPLGYITLVSLPMNIILQRYREYTRQIQEIVTSFLAIFLTIFIFFYVANCKILNTKRTSFYTNWHFLLKAICLISTLLLLRQVLFWMSFPGQILAESWNSPEIFHSLVFGDWSDSLANLFVTSLIILGITSVFFIYIPKIPIARLKKGQLLLAFGIILITPWICQGLADLLDFLIHEIIRHSSIEIFNFIQLLPSYEVLGIYSSCLCLGIAILMCGVWWMRHLLELKNNLSFQWTLAFISISLLLWLFRQIISEDVIVFRYFAGPFLLFVAVLLSTFQFPKRLQVRSLFILLLISGLLYLSLAYSCRLKIRTTIEDQSEEFQSRLYRQTMELSLDIFERNSEIVQALEEKKRDMAFLLWAKSPLSERLDNLHLIVFAKTMSENDRKKHPEAKEFFEKSQERFFILSQFSLNMPNSEPKLSDINPETRQILENVPGYGNEGQNLLFFRGILPIRNASKELIGVLALFIRYPKIGKVLPIPELFLKKNSTPAFPLLMNNFEDGIMTHSNNPYLPKDFRLSKNILAQVQNQQKRIWCEEKIENRWYDNFYFSWIEQTRISQPISDAESSKQSKESDTEQKRKEVLQSQIITKENIGMIGYPLWSWLFDIFYYIQFLLFNLSVTFFITFCYSIIKWFYQGHSWLQESWFSFEHKLLLVFILISGIPVFVMGFVNKQRAVDQIWENYTRILTGQLENAEKAVREETIPPLLPNQITSSMVTDSFSQSWGERNKSVLNFYLATYPFDLQCFPLLSATNRRELFQTELLSERLDGKAFYHLILQRKEIYITLESIANYRFVVGYKTLNSSLDKRYTVGIIAIPMIYQNEKVQSEIAEIVATIFTIYAIAFLLVVLVAIFLAYQISKPLTRLMSGIHKVSQGELNFEIPITSKDEFGKVVQAFNQMTKDLQSSRQKLIQAEKDAAWREMSRQIAHEIKNPLTPMKLSAQHIQRAYNDQAKNFDKILEKGINTIIDAIENLSRTASTFSEFAKFTKPNLGIYNLDSLLLDCINLFSHTENISIESQIEKLPEIITDPHQIKRVLINILTNAIQAIQKPPGKIKVIAQQISSTEISIMVQDNGVGIPESVKAHLFEPNFSTKTHGSGLGLAICKRAILLMGGDISIESQENQGTTVKIQLPIAAENSKLLNI